MHMYGQRAPQNGRLWVMFFVTKYRDFFVTKGGGGGGGSGADPPRPLYPSLDRAQWDAFQCGKYEPFLQCAAYPKVAETRPTVVPDTRLFLQAGGGGLRVCSET